MSISETLSKLASETTPSDIIQAKLAASEVAEMYGDGSCNNVVQVVRPLVMQKHKSQAEQF